MACHLSASCVTPSLTLRSRAVAELYLHLSDKLYLTPAAHFNLPAGDGNIKHHTLLQQALDRSLHWTTKSNWRKAWKILDFIFTLCGLGIIFYTTVSPVIHNHFNLYTDIRKKINARKGAAAEVITTDYNFTLISLLFNLCERNESKRRSVWWTVTVWGGEGEEHLSCNKLIRNPCAEHSVCHHRQLRQHHRTEIKDLQI